MNLSGEEKNDAGAVGKKKVRFCSAVARGVKVVAFLFQPHLSHHQRQSTDGLVQRPDFLRGADNEGRSCVNDRLATCLAQTQLVADSNPAGQM